jgi:RHS repeat-associated protein
MGWSYDSFGNRTSESFTATSGVPPPTIPLPTGSTAVYNANNQVSASSLMGGAGLGYDPSGAGNVIQDNQNRYLYDGDGRVCAAQALYFGAPTGAVTGYVYDADGNRVAKGTLSGYDCGSSFTETNWYVLGPGGEQMTEFAAADVTAANPSGWAHTNIFAAGELTATYDTVGLHFHLNDWLGTQRVQTDYLGNTEQSWQNLPFGEMVPANPYLGATEQHFTGKERDVESGNDYMFARYYNSASGRFLSPDWSAKEEPVPYARLNSPQSLNLYAYVYNNPLSGIDPDGHLGCGNSTEGFCNQDVQQAMIHGMSAGDAYAAGQSAQQQNAGGAGAGHGTPYNPINLGSTHIAGTFDPFRGSRGALGATIYADPSNCDSCRWIQGVKSSDTGGGKQFIDGHEVMGTVPLYPLEGGPSNELNDRPYRQSAVTWTAISVVGAVNGPSFTAMGAIKWGFSISASGRLSVSGPVRATAAEERNVLQQVQTEYTWTIK